MRPFEQMWAYSQNIVGAFDEREARALYNKCIELPTKSVVVEIGSYLGKSSSLLAQICDDYSFYLTCVDPFLETDVSEFKKNMDGVGAKYTLMTYPEFWTHGRAPWQARFEGTRQAGKAFKKEIDLLFIDGDHHKAGVELDLEVWGSKVKKGGTIVFHDYLSSWTGVKEAVDENPTLTGGEVYGTLAVKYKI